MKENSFGIPPHLSDEIGEVCDNIENLADLMALIASAAGNMSLDFVSKQEDSFDILH